jgi:hypothetical protein
LILDKAEAEVPSPSVFNFEGDLVTRSPFAPALLQAFLSTAFSIHFSSPLHRPPRFDMAILRDGSNEYEIRIKRYPDGTYFDEYIKLDNREQQGGTACYRYIVGEDGVRYTIEVTLKEGFTFGNFDQVQVQLNVQGQEEEVCVKNIFRPTDNSSDCPKRRNRFIFTNL